MNFLQRLFIREKEAHIETPPEQPVDATKPLTPPLAAPRPLSPGLHIGITSDIGQNPERDRNEDSLCAVNSTLFHEDIVEPFGIFVVADGMGGHQQGEVASVLATRTVTDQILREIYLPYLTQDSQSASNRPINEVLTSAVETANTVVHENTPDAGTTLTVAVVLGNNAYIAHVGDSRAYIYHQGKLKQITQDHSYVARLVELGQATPEEALTHRYRNVLYRALGQAGNLEVETQLQSLPPGSYLLLCSDGLWNMISDDEIARIIATSSSPNEACQQLVDQANANGGDDNITVIVIGIGENP
ncbi:MAG: Stp1/IreP family PP2C-type Ser/Thr phosphatase [Anaerolineae bacterium]